VTAPAPVSVSRWGELRGERKARGVVLRVLVDGQHAGSIAPDSDRWRACRQARALSVPWETEHATVEEALRAVLRSGFARTLGARAASRVYWSDKARQVVSRAGAR
jgi:Arc/MetJ family transcription regulator